MKTAVHRLIQSLPQTNPRLPHELQLKIAALGEFAVRARSQVPRDGSSKLILTVPEPESATRMPQQLPQLAKGSALIAGRDVVSEDDYAIARRAAFDSIPAVRRNVLDLLIAGSNISLAQLPPSTLHYVTEELQSLGLLCNNALSTLAQDLLRTAGII